MARGSNIGLGVDFQPGVQEGLINNRGSTMLHEIAVSCTCRVDDVYSNIDGDGVENRREAFCPRCGGSGWLHRSPKVVVGLAVGIRQQRNILDAGVAQSGDMSFSPLPAEGDCDESYARRISQYDKLTALWSQPLDDGQVIVRAAGTTNDIAGLVTYLNTNEDRLWYEPASAIWCEDENGVRYNEGADFTLGPGKIIRWVGGKPIDGLRYSLKYSAFFEWIVWQPPQERVDRNNVDLGPLCMLRRRHIAFVNDNPAGTRDDNVPLQSRVSC